MTPSPTRATRSNAGRMARPACRFVALASLLAALAITACENPLAPMSCGPIPQQTVNAGQSTTVSVCFTDENGDALSYSASSSNPAVATATVSGTTVTITAVAPGSTTVTITASDPGGLTATASVSVMVPNRAPRAVGTIDALTVAVGEQGSVNVSGAFTDPDGETLSYSASSSNPEVATASASGSAVAVTAVAKGMSTVTVTATDPGGASATQSFEVTVPNRAPQAVGSIPQATVQAGESVEVDLSEYFTDPDGDALAYMGQSSDAAVATVSVENAVAIVTAVSSGTATVMITATDPGDASATQSFEVTVPNRAPAAVGSIPAQTVTEGRTETVTLRPYFADPDGDSLTYTAVITDPQVAEVTVAEDALTIRALATGVAAITVTATDPDGLTATQTVAVEVTPSNRAPQPQGTIPAQSVTVGGTATVDLSPYFTDPDGDALTYTAQSSDPTLATVGVSGAVATVTGIAVGTATATVTATDPDGLTATQTVSIEVMQGNRAPQPQGTIPAQSIAVGVTATVNLSQYFTDADGDALTYTAQSSDPAVATVSVLGSVATVKAVAPGTVAVTATATDPGNASATQRFDVTVANRAPETVGSIPAATVEIGTSVDVNLAQYFTDPDGDALTYAAASDDRAVATVSVSGAVATVTAVAAGTATVTVTASDPGGLSATQSIAVNTFDADDATLRSLSLSDGTLNPAFDPATLNYAASVAHAVSSIRVTAVASHGDDGRITIDGAAYTAGGHAVDLVVGTNTILVRVTSLNGNFVNTYTVTVERAEDVPSAPQNVEIESPRDQEVVVRWRAPASEGSEVIANYRYRLSDGAWMTAGGGATARSVEIPGLTNGHYVTVWVQAVTANFEGDSASVNGAPWPDVTVTPTASSVDESGADNSTQVTVALTTLAVSPTRIDLSVLEGTDASDKATIAPATLTFAPGDLAKSVTLTAVDNVTDDPDPVITLQADVAETEAMAAATRAPGMSNITIIDNDTVPDVPQGISFSAVGTDAFTVNWTPPASEGTSAITGYEVRFATTASGDIGDASWATVSGGGDARSHVISGLTTDTDYTVEVRAVSAAGAGNATSAAQRTN